MKKNILAVVLCAGEGTRISEHYKDIPKPLIPIDNNSILENLLDNLLELGLKRIFLVKGHLGHKIDEFANEFRRKHNITSSNLAVIDSREDYKLGPLHSFLSIINDSKVFKKELFYIVIPGDIIFEKELLREILIKIPQRSNDTPTLFYRERHIKDIEKDIIPIAIFGLSGHDVILRRIDQVVKKDGDLMLKQIIPLFFTDYYFIRYILQLEQVKSVQTLREAINILCSRNYRVEIVKLTCPNDFYDIDTKVDLDEYLRNRK